MVALLVCGQSGRKCSAREPRQAAARQMARTKPFGYIYDHRLRNIVPEPKEAKIVKKIYEEFATGRHTLKSISARLAEIGGGKARSNYSIENLLTNDRYIGVMRWNGEAHEGKYRPLITKQLFAKVQEVLANRRKPRKSKKRHDFPFVGLFNCSCGFMFTAQFAKGNGGLYRYYRCTRKYGACAEKYIKKANCKNKLLKNRKQLLCPLIGQKECWKSWSAKKNIKLNQQTLSQKRTEKDFRPSRKIRQTA